MRLTPQQYRLLEWEPRELEPSCLRPSQIADHYINPVEAAITGIDGSIRQAYVCENKRHKGLYAAKIWDNSTNSYFKIPTGVGFSRLSAIESLERDYNRFLEQQNN